MGLRRPLPLVMLEHQLCHVRRLSGRGDLRGQAGACGRDTRSLWPLPDHLSELQDPQAIREEVHRPGQARICNCSPPYRVVLACRPDHHLP